MPSALLFCKVLARKVLYHLTAIEISRLNDRGLIRTFRHGSFESVDVFQ